MITLLFFNTHFYPSVCFTHGRMRRRHVKKEFKEEVDIENSGCLPYSKKDPNKMTNYYTSVEMDIWHRQYGNTGCGVFKRGVQN